MLQVLEIVLLLKKKHVALQFFYFDWSKGELSSVLFRHCEMLACGTAYMCRCCCGDFRKLLLITIELRLFVRRGKGKYLSLSASIPETCSKTNAAQVNYKQKRENG